MKKIYTFVLIIFLSYTTFSLQAQDTLTIRYASVYRGKNVYVQNPYYKDSLFCTCEVRVNGKTQPVALDRSSYEIDLSTFQQNDSITIEILHHRGCIPKVLNVHIGHSRPHIFKNISYANERVAWKCFPKIAPGKFIVEHYEYATWTRVAELNMEDSTGNDTVIMSAPVHSFSGLNKYRVKYVSSKEGSITYTAILDVISALPPLKIDINETWREVLFSREAEYFLLNNEGKIERRGYDKALSLGGLPAGVYYLNADGQTKKIRLKKEEMVP